MKKKLKKTGFDDPTCCPSGDHHIKLNDITGSVGSSSVGGLCNSHNQTSASETTSGEDGPRLVGGTAASCSSSGDTGSGMKLIPDKDNPPQEMLDWVESFSRWAHAQRLLAIDQLIGRCEPVQVSPIIFLNKPCLCYVMTLDFASQIREFVIRICIKQCHYPKK